MPLILKKCAILLVPRCGSTWTRQAIRNAHIPYKEFGPKHGTELPADAPKFVMAFTREPGTWLKSRHVIGPWDDSMTAFWDKDFEVFRGRVSDDMVRMYLANYTRKADYVGRQESLADHLVKGLADAGMEGDYDEELLRATPSYHVSDYERREVIIGPPRPNNPMRQPFRVA